MVLRSAVLLLAITCALAGGACGATHEAPRSADVGRPVVPVHDASPAGELQDEPVVADQDAAVDDGRPESDHALDPGRKPAEMMAFFAIAPGARVAELMAGTGYTTELLSRAVGKSGKVYGQNNRFVLEKFAEKPWSERLARAALSNVVRIDRELDDPLPADAHGLDAVVMVLFYHDAVWMKVDRDAMNRAVFKALKPGGSYFIIDHSAESGHGPRDAKTLHRMDENSVAVEVSRAGFVVGRKASFLRNPDDRRDWNASPSAAGAKRGTSDRFVREFVKPKPPTLGPVIATDATTQACSTDADCVVSLCTTQCCTFVCPPGLVVNTKTEKACTERRRLTCDKRLCAAPHPCRTPEFRYSARCENSRCVGDRHAPAK